MVRFCAHSFLHFVPSNKMETTKNWFDFLLACFSRDFTDLILVILDCDLLIVPLSGTAVKLKYLEYCHKMPAAKKFRNGKRTTCDRISELPSCVIENILMYLPTRDAARTSILSRKWRYNWSKIPQLVLDDTLWDVSVANQTLCRKKFVETLYQILSLRQGPIFKFNLSITGLEGCTEIDNLIVLLSRSRIKDFTLKLCLGEYYRMPSSFFCCLELRRLNLWSCIINPTTTFNGFSQLISLKLSQVDIASKVLGRLISSCPLLEQLKLQLPNGLSNLEIIAPKLKSFIVKTLIKYIFFKNTPVLAMVSLVARTHDFEEIFHEGGKLTFDNFRGLPSLENLHMDDYFIKSLFSGGTPTRITTPLIHLKVLNLTYISLHLPDEICFVLCLIRSAPNLQEIEISASHLKVFLGENDEESKIEEFLDVHDYSEVTFNKLREVKMRNIVGMSAHLEFIKLFLEKSPILEKMLIEPFADDADLGKWILKQVTRYRRASPNAEVIFEDPVED